MNYLPEYRDIYCHYNCIGCDVVQLNITPTACKECRDLREKCPNCQGQDTEITSQWEGICGYCLGTGLKIHPSEREKLRAEQDYKRESMKLKIAMGEVERIKPFIEHLEDRFPHLKEM